MYAMKRLTAYVSGNVQRVGYGARVIKIANGMGLKGFVENLNDGRVRIVAEGEEEKLKLFEETIDIRNTLNKVSSLEKKHSEDIGDFVGFYKLVETGETDSRLDKGIGVLKDMKEVLILILNKQGETISEIKETNKNLGNKMDLMLEKQDDTISEIRDTNANLGSKMDLMHEKQDETIFEIRDMNSNLNDKMEKVLDKSDIVELKGDVADMKSALRAKGII
jgi:acylphosphatase